MMAAVLNDYFTSMEIFLAYWSSTSFPFSILGKGLNKTKFKKAPRIMATVIPIKIDPGVLHSPNHIRPIAVTAPSNAE
jgi:hypothetical protein